MTKIVFMGTPDFSAPILGRLVEEGYDVALVVTQPDRPKGRKKVLTPPPVKVKAEALDIPVYQPEKIKDDIEPIKNINPDIIITAAFGQILPKELLDLPRLGCINVHASLLPKLRGGAPIHYALLEGHKETGVTIMYMVEKLDAGDIISQKAIDIKEDDHVGSLHDKLSIIGTELLIETLPDIIAEKAKKEEQDESKVTYAFNIKREQEKIDWNRPARDIYNQIRGLNPWPVAYTILEEQPLKIWWGEIVHEVNSSNPGEVDSIDEEGFVVKTDDQKGIKILELQPSGKKKMLASEFLRGVGSKLELGERLK
ncbi:methionyl-tRNA formyltransferase [Saliterribacillus persicus]|uniref:Methionyl-tRNA formyltransferase n=1 Tax=Saliterribacillus persicus TaxID=930114 RepID=A0A368XXM7_9BACI|nr:methionyl-tRNA formyltransferase [Saliterribacillus persicus]RCW70764.1 methionyl-tRNA formyltransferase [Saliterribacillus persicus]